MGTSSFKRAVLKVAQFVSRPVGQKNFGRLILFLARIGRIDLLTFAYNTRGILNHENAIVSGEDFVIKNVLKKEIRGKEPVLFDIGANKGDYAESLLKEFPGAKIFAFEPTPAAYGLLKERFSGTTVRTFNIGFGSEKAAKKIYSYAHDTGSPHSSIFREVFTDIHHTGIPEEIDFTCTTVDDFCSENSIGSIDFMKIDTEGNDLNILKGAARMLKEDKIRFIQFEFNEMNIISRVFLRDFYTMLDHYEFYRLSEKRLIPLGAYNPSNEIFKFQNIFAVNKKLHQL